MVRSQPVFKFHSVYRMRIWTYARYGSRVTVFVRPLSTAQSPMQSAGMWLRLA